VRRNAGHAESIFDIGAAPANDAAMSMKLILVVLAALGLVAVGGLKLRKKAGS
jgi:hypothetical protein